MPPKWVHQHRAGKIRMLAVMAAERLAGELAEVPTASEQGLDIDWPIWRGSTWVGKVSDADYQWWVDTFKKLVETPEFKQEREDRGLFAFTMIGADYDELVKADVARFVTGQGSRAVIDPGDESRV